MSYRSLFISIIVSILLFSFSARSQQPASLRGSDERATAALRKKAIDLLELVAGQVSSLHSVENRARIGSNVAALLWDHDEKRSRSLFGAVAEDIKAGFNDTDPDYSAHIRTVMVFRQLRIDTLDRIAKHDPELALEFLRATQPATDLQLPFQMRAGEKDLELRLASQVAATNPQLTLKLGRQSLERGFSADLLPLLSQLRWKNTEGLLSFYKAVVDKLKGANLPEDSAATEIALYLAHAFRPPEVDEQVYRDLIGVLLTSALARGCGEATVDNPPHNICFQIGSLFSRVEMYYGSRAAPLKRLAEESPGVSAAEMWEPIRHVIEKGTVDEILALAAKYPQMQIPIYWGALTKAKDSGDLTRARQIAADLPDAGQRKSMLAQLDRDEMWKSLNADKLALVQQQLTGLRRNEERIQFLFRVASQAGGNDRKAALELLNQAAQIIESTKAGKTRLGAQIALAMMYCSLNSDRGFAIMESLMPRLNELVAAAATLDGFDNNYFRDGEWNMTGEGGVGELLTRLAQNAGYFALIDFDRSVTLANQLERPELRLMAELKLAQSVLSSQPLQTPVFRLH